VTPQRARQLSGRWLIIGVALFVARTAVAALGFDEFSLPLTVAMWLAFLQAVGHQQWAKGHEASTSRAAQLTAEEDR
jgi:hypothetical protein